MADARNPTITSKYRPDINLSNEYSKQLTARYLNDSKLNRNNQFSPPLVIRQSIRKKEENFLYFPVSSSF